MKKKSPWEFSFVIKWRKMHAAMASFIKRYGHHFGYSNSVEFLHSNLIFVVTFDDIN